MIRWADAKRQFESQPGFTSRDAARPIEEAASVILEGA
jgi:hypothetical protein